MLKPVLDTLDGVEEAVKTLYVEKDGKFLLDVEGVTPNADVDGLRRNRDDILKEKKEAETALRAFTDAGVDLEEYARLKDEERTREGKKMVPASEVEALATERTREAVERAETAVKTAEDALAETNALLDKSILENQVIQAAEDAAVRGKAIGTVVTMARSAGWRREGEGVVLVGSDGKPVYGVAGQPKTLKEWVEGLKEEGHEYLFEDSSGGGGSHQNTQGGGGMTTHPLKWSTAQKAKFIEEKGLAEYQKRLAAPAG